MPHPPFTFKPGKKIRLSRLDTTSTGDFQDSDDAQPKLNKYIKQLTEATPQADGQSDLRRLFLYDPSRTRHLMQFTQEVMRAPGPLPPGER